MLQNGLIVYRFCLVFIN